jgi:hypothetical protein
MIEAKHIKESLSGLNCYRCGKSLERARFTTVAAPTTSASLALLAHVVCAKCQAQSMVTVTPSGMGAVPLVTDLTEGEFIKFVGSSEISYEEILNLHKKLKKQSIWNLMQKKEKS